MPRQLVDLSPERMKAGYRVELLQACDQMYWNKGEPRFPKETGTEQGK